jgi:hypothetical protein
MPPSDLGSEEQEELQEGSDSCSDKAKQLSKGKDELKTHMLLSVHAESQNVSLSPGTTVRR